MESEAGDFEELLSEERTLLAKERTSLSYIRTGTALVAVGLGALKFFEADFWISFLGTLMTVIGLLVIVYHAMWDRRYMHRIRYFERKIHKFSSDEKVTDASLKDE